MSKIIDHFLFFSDKINDDTLILDKDETTHALSVLRIRIGDSIFVTDGKGTIYFCSYSSLVSNCCLLKIIKKKKQESTLPHLNVFVGLPEKESFESVLTALVPLGVMSITPIVCKYCQKKWWSKKWDKHTMRFQKKMIVATKQSWNAWIPILNEPVSINSAVSMANETIIVADEKGAPFVSINKNLIKPKALSCFIGPPGGFSDDELSNLQKAGGLFTKISKHRLRTELAVTVMVGNLIQFFLNK